MSKKIFEIFTMVFVVFVLVVFVFGIYAYTNAKGIEDNLLRLHVIANSDTLDDQKTKIEVRDKVIEYFRKHFGNCHNKEEMENLVAKDITNIADFCKDYLRQQGKDYGVKVELGESNFPTKDYGSFKVPAGNYEALRIILGNGAGKNWWCVLFPPLCMADASVVKDYKKEENGQASEILRQKLSDEEYRLITSANNDNKPIKFKFKIVELFQESKIKISMLYKSR